MGKRLVAYFSASGRTKILAEILSVSENTTLFEIKPLVPYTKADLDWANKESRTSIEMENRHFRPKIENVDPHIEEYDEICLCFPIWHSLAPTIINTFLDRYDFDGRKIMVFATSDMENRLGNALKEELQWSAPNTTFEEGHVFTRRAMNRIINALNESAEENTEQ